MSNFIAAFGLVHPGKQVYADGMILLGQMKKRFRTILKKLQDLLRGQSFTIQHISLD